ncbi:MAG: SOS response-associated peptidase family protein [Rhizorhabdus sp.]|uniref:SOS response-associated peptidase family protein n=1 Tax=Rhizorhabdus sp. TaxID=1968843 RepID=UPI001B6EB040|nr:SOS response-associated peptidase family protein [Rhizorhabdus sp.]MBP8232127.1 SOS response-associated peptidase family protein [Rhizorhabdus sp.]
MCNLYRILAGQDAIRRGAGVMVDLTGNLEQRVGGIYPDYPAPIVRHGPNGRELALARWGMPTPPARLTGTTDKGITNLRNLFAWKEYLEPADRCLVPFTAFAEPESLPDGSKGTAWFALGPDQPLAFFAGVCLRGWKGLRKKAEGEVMIDIYGFLTTDANADVRPVHEKAMPVILRPGEECEEWMTAPARGLKRLQRPLPDCSLVVVERQGSRKKTVPEEKGPQNP